MKPILYAPSETEFNTQGVGVLADVVSCAVTEERNGIFELQMVYSVDGIHYEDLKHSYIILAKVGDDVDTQPFRIYRITKPLNGRVTVYAEHISYQMSYIPVKPFSSQTARQALTVLPSKAVEPNPFTFWTDKETVASFSIEEPKSMRSVLGGERGSLLDVYGGEWMFDRFLARLYQSRGADRGVTFRYGKNITDINQDENIADTITGIMPFWKDQQTENDMVLLDEYVVYSDNADLYPFKRVKPMDFSSDFQNRPTQEQLRNRALSYIQSAGIGVPVVSIRVSIVSLWQTEEYKDLVGVEKVSLCDTVTVEYPALKVSAKAKVIKTVYDVLTERYTSIELGEARSNFAKTLRNVQNELTESLANDYATKTLLQKSVERATSQITGGLGGYVVTRFDANDRPQELLILGDSPDYTLAQKVWRWNRNGLGYSSTGYDGTYGLAMTADGHIVADFVDTGTLTANVIKAGILSDVAGKNYWDLTTGEFRLTSATEIVDGSTTVELGDFVTDLIDDSMDQESVFNALTNNGSARGIILYNGHLFLNASYIQTGSMNASLIKTGSLSADRISGGTLKIGDSSDYGIIEMYRNGACVGRWDGNSFALGSLTETSGVYSGNLTISYTGLVTAKRFRAEESIYMNATSSSSYLKMPCNTQSGTGYLEISTNGIKISQNNMTLEFASTGFPTDGSEATDYTYNYTGFKLSQGNTTSGYLVTIARDGIYLDKYYGRYTHLTNEGLTIGDGSLIDYRGDRFQLTNTKMFIHRDINITVQNKVVDQIINYSANTTTVDVPISSDKAIRFRFVKGFFINATTVNIN